MTQIDRINGLIGSIAVKAPCRVATTANITLSGEQTIDDISVVAGDRVLVKNQTSDIENGIYDCSTTSWTRSPDFNGARDFTEGTTIRVIAGTVNENLTYNVSSSGVNVGVSSITFALTSLPFQNEDSVTYGTVALMKLESPQAGLLVTTKGYYTAGDGGGATYLIKAPQAFDGYGDHELANSNIAVLQIDSVVNISQFGAKGDNTTDDSTAIQACIDYAESVGGLRIIFNQGKYIVNTGLVVDDDGVFLIGGGHGNISYSGAFDYRESATTTLKWGGATGSGIVVKFTSDAANGGTGTKKGGGGIVGIFIDCQEKAAVGFELESWSTGVFDMAVGWAHTLGYKIWTLSNGLAKGVTDSQHNQFENLNYLETNTTQNPLGCFIGGNTTGNTSLNVFKNIRIYTDGSGNSLEFGDADANHFARVSAGHRTGTGGAVIFHADDTAPYGSGHFRHNAFSFTQFRRSLTVKETVAGTKASQANIIYHYSLDNGGATPTVEPGAHIIILEQVQSPLPPGLARLVPVETNVLQSHIKEKSADETVNNSTTLQDDDELKITEIPANTKIGFKLRLLYVGDATADIKVAFTIPSGTIRWAPRGSIRVASGDALTVSNSIQVSGNATDLGCHATGIREAYIEGSATLAGVGGAFQVQWAQNTAVVADTVVKSGSILSVDIYV